MKRQIVHSNKLTTLYRRLVILEDMIKDPKAKEECAMIIERFVILVKLAEDYEDS